MTASQCVTEQNILFILLSESQLSLDFLLPRNIPQSQFRIPENCSISTKTQLHERLCVKVSPGLDGYKAELMILATWYMHFYQLIRV